VIAMGYKYCVVWGQRTHTGVFSTKTKQWRPLIEPRAKMFHKLRCANTFKNEVGGKIYELVVL
jgi:hypothetical protein